MWENLNYLFSLLFHKWFSTFLKEEMRGFLSTSLWIKKMQIGIRLRIKRRNTRAKCWEVKVILPFSSSQVSGLCGQRWLGGITGGTEGMKE